MSSIPSLSVLVATVNIKQKQTNVKHVDNLFNFPPSLLFLPLNCKTFFFLCSLLLSLFLQTHIEMFMSENTPHTISISMNISAQFYITLHSLCKSLWFGVLRVRINHESADLHDELLPIRTTLLLFASKQESNRYQISSIITKGTQKTV